MKRSFLSMKEYFFLRRVFLFFKEYLFFMNEIFYKRIYPFCEGDFSDKKNISFCAGYFFERKKKLEEISLMDKKYFFLQRRFLFSQNDVKVKDQHKVESSLLLSHPTQVFKNCDGKIFISWNKRRTNG